MNKIECFKIQLLQKNDSISFWDINKAEPILTINCLNSCSLLNPTIIVADPFLFVHVDTLYLFYESKDLNTPGVIKMISTKDLKQWSDPITVMKEDFHLSYPFVFYEEGSIYMMPETGADGSICIYEATNNTLTNWELKKKLLVQPASNKIRMSYSDSSIYKKDEIYYLMTTLKYANGINTLELYYSESLLGEYKVHPQSPIVCSQQLGRNAGCLQLIDGVLYRYSQDCTARYGDNVNVSQVTTLSPLDYKEQVLKENIFPTHTTFYREGGHQLHLTRFCGKTIIATDAKEYHYLLLSRVAKLLLYR